LKLLAPVNLEKAERFLWALTLLTVPVTSFRFMPFMGADSQVRPLSLIPAGLLLFVIVIRSMQQRRLLFWNTSMVPLLAFLLAALLSSALGFFLAPPDLYNYAYSSRLLRAWVTFGVGMIFFIVPMSMNRDEQDLKFTLKWLFIGLAGHVLWSLVQLFYFYIVENYFNEQIFSNWLDQIQKTVMMAGLSPNRRISGLALEPSWLAAQVVTIYLPWFFAAVVKGYIWSKPRWLAPVCLVACGGLILFTFSRSGILIAVLAVLLTFLVTGSDWIRRAWLWFGRPFRAQYTIRSRQSMQAAVRIVICAALLAGLAGGALIVSQNKYFASIWQSDKRDPISYLVDIYAGPRLAAAWAGWTIFVQYPLTGVGLGATGLYFHQALPDWAHFNITEVSQLFSPAAQIYPNAKNLYIRVLAETGIVGFWLLLSFYLLLLGKIRGLLRSPRRELIFVGTASLLAWIGIMVLGFTQDSFAMLNIWMPLGILVGMENPRS